MPLVEDFYTIKAKDSIRANRPISSAWADAT